MCFTPTLHTKACLWAAFSAATWFDPCCLHQFCFITLIFLIALIFDSANTANFVRSRESRCRAYGSVACFTPTLHTKACLRAAFSAATWFDPCCLHQILVPKSKSFQIFIFFLQPGRFQLPLEASFLSLWLCLATATLSSYEIANYFRFIV